MPFKSPQTTSNSEPSPGARRGPFAFQMYLIGRYRPALYPNITLNGGTNPRRENMLLNADKHVVHP